MNETSTQTILTDLHEHLELCGCLLGIVQRESQTLRQTEDGLGAETAAKKDLLPALDLSLNKIRQHRIEWHKQSPLDRARETGVAALLGQIQDLIMKIIVLDRENEQVLLRKGLVPARHLPSANRQRPHYVAGLYRRQADPIDAGASPGPALASAS
jgi:hypothetical protein